MKQRIKAAEEHHFRIFGANACSVRFTLACGHVEIRKLSDVPRYRVNETALKCRTCTSTQANRSRWK